MKTMKSRLEYIWNHYECLSPCSMLQWKEEDNRLWWRPRRFFNSSATIYRWGVKVGTWKFVWRPWRVLP